MYEKTLLAISFSGKYKFDELVVFSYKLAYR